MQAFDFAEIAVFRQRNRLLKQIVAQHIQWVCRIHAHFAFGGIAVFRTQSAAIAPYPSVKRFGGAVKQRHQIFRQRLAVHIAHIGQASKKEREIHFAALQRGKHIGHQFIIAFLLGLQAQLGAHFIQIGRLKKLGKAL